MGSEMQPASRGRKPDDPGPARRTTAGTQPYSEMGRRKAGLGLRGPVALREEWLCNGQAPNWQGGQTHQFVTFLTHGFGVQLSALLICFILTICLIHLNPQNDEKTWEGKRGWPTLKARSGVMRNPLGIDGVKLMATVVMLSIVMGFGCSALQFTLTRSVKMTLAGWEFYTPTAINAHIKCPVRPCQSWWDFKLGRWRRRRLRGPKGGQQSEVHRRRIRTVLSGGSKGQAGTQMAGHRQGSAIDDGRTITKFQGRNSGWPGLASPTADGENKPMEEKSKAGPGGWDAARGSPLRTAIPGRKFGGGLQGTEARRRKRHPGDLAGTPTEDGKAGPEGWKDAPGTLQRAENAREKSDKGTPEARARRGPGPFRAKMPKRPRRLPEGNKKPKSEGVVDL